MVSECLIQRSALRKISEAGALCSSSGRTDMGKADNFNSYRNRPYLSFFELSDFNVRVRLRGYSEIFQNAIGC